MNINAIWSLYLSIVPPQLISLRSKPDLGQTDKREEQKSAQIDCDFRNTEILQVTKLIARGS